MKLINYITRIYIFLIIFLGINNYVFPQNKITVFPYQESFEAGLGEWVQSAADDIDWTINTGETSSAGTGPDGALDGDYYIYTEASGGNTNSNAYLDASFDFTALTNPYLLFYHHMYGAYIGSLHIDVWDGSWDLDVYSINGQQQTSSSDPWDHDTIDLSAYAGSDSVVIRFRGLTGNGFTSDISVDNIYIIDYVDMSFISATCSQPDTSIVSQGSLNNQLLLIEIITDGFTNPLQVDSLNILPTGSDNFAVDVDSVLIYYTGNDTVFNTSNLFGSANTLDRPISGTQILSYGSNYFWVAYNVSAVAQAENIIDAECSEIYFEGPTTQIPTITDPYGSRMVDSLMNIDYVTCTQITDDIAKNSDSVPVIQINIVTQNTSNPLSLESFLIDSLGTDNFPDNIDHIRIFSTGPDITFNTDSIIWDSTAFSSPVNVSYMLLPGNNYFWIAYDLSSNSIIDDVIDARCISVRIQGADYVPIVGDPAGSRTITEAKRFSNFMSANLVIGQPDFTSQLTTTNEYIVEGASNSAVSSKGVLAIGSQVRGAVLIWHEIPDTNGAPADVIVGNPDFYTDQDGTTASLMRNAESVCFSPDGNKLIASDGYNNRVLIWNFIPTTNGQPADVVIGQTDFTTGTAGTDADKFDYPWGVFVTPDGKLIVGDLYNNRFLVFNEIPTENGISADLVIGQPDFTTNTAGTTSSSLNSPMTCTMSPDGKLILSDWGNHRVLIFNDFPKENGADADIVIGQNNFTTGTPGLSDSEFNIPVGVTASPDGKLAVGDFANNRVLIFNEIPIENGASADIVLGQPDFTSNDEFNGGISDKSMAYPYGINFDLNGRLFVNGRDMNRVMVFGNALNYTADLEITMIPDNYSVNVRESISYTTTIINHGPTQSSNVIVKSALPALFKLKTYIPEEGEYEPYGGLWTIPHIGIDDTITLILNGIVIDGNGNITAYSSIEASDAKDDNYDNNAVSVQVLVHNESPTITGFSPDTIEANTSTEWIPFTIGDADTDISDLVLSAVSSDPDIIDVSQVEFKGDDDLRYVRITPNTDSSGTVFITIQVSDEYSTSESNLLLHVLSVNNNLSDLQVDGVTITGFNLTQHAYSYKLSPGTVIVPTVTATAQDAVSTIDIYATDSLPGITSINVTAENGSTGTYYVSFSDSILAASDSTLSDLRIDGVTVEGFSPFILEYTQILPYGTIVVPTVTATASDIGATVDIRQTASLPGIDSVVVTASNGTSIQIYIINYTIDSPEDNANLTELYVDGELVLPFNPDTIFYDIEVSYGTIVAPVVNGITDDANATLVITQATGIPDSATIEVTAEDGVTNKTYTIGFTMAPPSDDATLSNIKVNGTSIFGFNPDTLDYTILLKNDVISAPTVTATSSHIDATVIITNATSIPDTAEIIVVAEDGVSTLTYNVIFDYELLNDNAQLSSINMNDVLLSGFDPDTYIYNIELPAGTSIVPTITYTKFDKNASDSIWNATSLPGTTSITVKAEDGVTTLVYYINFTLDKLDDATLSDLRVDGTTITGFDPAILTYNIELAEGTTIVPTVTATTTDINATAVIADAPGLPGTTTVDVTAEDGITTLQYAINFSVAPALSTDTTLSDLQVDGITISGFAPFIFDYEYALPFGTTIVPVVTATLNDPLASVVITDAPSLPDTTFINVTAQNPSYTSEYTVRFTINPPSDNADLLDLLVDGITINGFNADDTMYTYLLPYGETMVPVVTAIAEHDSATIEIIDATTIPDTTFVIVTAQDVLITKTYKVIFEHVAPNDDAHLDSIIIDGIPLSTFNSNVFIYNFELAEGTTIVPTVTVVKSDTNATTIITDAPALPGTTEILVTAEDGITELTYSINFSVEQPVGQDATLSSIRYDGILVDGFSPTIYNYNVELPYGTTIVPTVTVTPTDASATVVISQAPALPGQATIDVTSVDGTNDTTYTVNFTIALNNNATLSDLLIDGTTVTGFDPATLIYDVELPYGTTVVPTVTATATDGNATVAITDAVALPGTTDILVTAEDGVSTLTYQVNFTIALNDDATLSDLLIDGTTVTGFNSATLIYDIELPYGTTVVPTVTATATDGNATVAITDAVALPGTTDILVTAEDGVTTLTYQVNFTIVPNDDATLSDLLIDGTTVTGFNPDTLIYDIELPYGTTVVPTVTATATDGNATIAITDAVVLPGTTDILVTAEDGVTTLTYQVNFTIAPNNDATLSDLLINGTTVAGFHPDTLIYDVILPYGTTTVPSVTATATDNNATVAITNAPGLPGTAYVLVTAEDDTTTLTYQLNFTIALNNDATLSDLLVNGVTIAGFRADSLTYDMLLPFGTTIVPTVTAVATDNDATVTITDAVSLPGTTSVLVTAEDGITSLTYEVNFTIASASNDASLSDLQVDGTTVTGFNPTTLNYSVELPYGTTDIPTITAIPNVASATVVITQALALPGQATVEVTSQDGLNNSTYSVFFTVADNNDATLSNLQIDGSTITGFDPAILIYNILLPIGTTTVPVVTATSTDINADVDIYDTDTLPGTTTIIVTAEDGITINTYKVNFDVATVENDATLSDLQIDGSTVTGFNPLIVRYDIVLPAGTSIVPDVTATANHTGAYVLITDATSIPGTTTIKVTSQDSTEIKIYEIYFTVETSSTELSLKNAVKLFPNPSDGIVTVLIKLNTLSDAHIEVVDMIGRKVIIENLQGVNNTEFEINLTNSAKGMYLVKITLHNKTIIKTLVIR